MFVLRLTKSLICLLAAVTKINVDVAVAVAAELFCVVTLSIAMTDVTINTVIVAIFKEILLSSAIEIEHY